MAALLLDTHVLLWANEAPERLSSEAVAALEDPANDLLVSSISVAEIEIKRRLGKLTLEHSCHTLVWLDHRRDRCSILPDFHAHGVTT